MKAKYDYIGRGYNQTRRADPFLTERLGHYLMPNTNGIYLDIGCGTGNYTQALQQKGFKFIGIDPAIEMLAQARQKNQHIDWRLGQADNTHLEANSITGVMASLTIHHWPNLFQGFKELYRVLKNGGNLVIFTSTPTQMKGYWLNHYFPRMLEASIKQMPSFETVTTALGAAGFSIVATEKYTVKPDLADLFLYSGKHYPELYFRPEVRNGISSFANLSCSEEVKAGLFKLQQDLATDRFKSIATAYENGLGDYLFITGKK